MGGAEERALSVTRSVQVTNHSTGRRNGEDCDKLAKLEGDLFDSFASEYVECGGQDIAEPLPRSVRSWFLSQEGVS